ncbi:uncharacterized protein ACJ7VT_018754 [Polymixia lowei]
MMEVVYVAAVVLSLLSVGQSAPLNDCENLIRPLENPGTDMILGTWVIIAMSADVPGMNELAKNASESSWFNYTAGSQNNTITVTQAQKLFGQCINLKFSMTFENKSFHIVKPIRSSVVLLNTVCPDCFLGHEKTIIGGTTFGALHLLSKRRTVTAAELDEFEKQVKCLNLPSPVIMDPEKDLCPDPQTPSQIIEVTDTDGALVISKFLEEIVNTEGGMMALGEKLKSALAKAKES